jgi:hypothetical protein
VTGLANDGEGFAFGNAQIHMLDGAHDTAARSELHGEVVNIQ